jgi:BT1 family/PUCC protein
MEDGYIAWSSIYLHEYFGFEIYTPLTKQQEDDLKQLGAQVPRWMYEFTSLPNLAIPMSYFCIGVALQLLRTPLIVYFIEDLNATAAEVNVLFTVMAVPWCFKVLYGFLSDCVPISGLRRKPYFMTGWLVYIASNLILMTTPFPSIQLCILLVFAQTAGYMLADVMTDALIVERSRYETEETRGTMQSTGYIIRFFGSTIGATIGAVVYNKDNWSWYLPIRLVFFINAAFPMIFLVPIVPYLLELDGHCIGKNFWVQCNDLFNTAQLHAVWQPMTFVYVYNALQLTNAAWMNFLVEGLDFSAWMIGIVSIVGSIMAWFGIMTYKRFFFASNWRIVYFWCTTLASSIALGQLGLVFGLNRRMGIPDIWFSMGDDVLVEFVIAVQFLPMCIMYLGLCPPGSEGTTYAMLTTWSNLAGSLAFDISTALTMVWDVSSETIASGDYSGIWKLSLLCGLIGPVPLLLLGLIPKNKEDQRKLQADNSRHYWAGVAFISVMILTLFITFVESVYEVYFNDDASENSTADTADGGAGDEQRFRRLKRLMVGH